MYYVYILQLVNQTYYIGFSSDLKQRILAHKQGDVPQTRKKCPLELIFYCAFSSKKKALDFEQYLKTGSGFAFRNRHFV